MTLTPGNGRSGIFLITLYMAPSTIMIEYTLSANLQQIVDNLLHERHFYAGSFKRTMPYGKAEGVLLGDPAQKHLLDPLDSPSWSRAKGEYDVDEMGLGHHWSQVASLKRVGFFSIKFYGDFRRIPEIIISPHSIGMKLCWVKTPKIPSFLLVWTNQ